MIQLKFKTALKDIARNLGLEIFILKTLPFGINHYRDMARFFQDKPQVVFDVGANIGQTSMSLRKFFPDSIIYAFEPVASTYTKLIDNTKDANVKAYNFGFGDEEKKSELFLQDDSGLNSLVEDLNKPKTINSSPEKVAITTLNNFCSQENIHIINFLKIDTEGYGLNVLNGAKRLLQKGNINWIFIEVGFNKNDKRHDSFKEVTDLLGSYSYHIFGFYEQWIENGRLEYCNALYSRK